MKINLNDLISLPIKKISTVIFAGAFLYSVTAVPIAEASLWQERQERLQQDQERGQKLDRLISHAQEEPAQAAETNPLGIKIPETYGDLVASWKSENNTGAPIVIHIQDAHGNYPAQRNAVEILRHFREQSHGAALPVYVEGAWQQVYPELLHAIPRKEFRAKILEQSLQQGTLVGEEYLSALEGPDFLKIVGTEDEKIYKANLTARHWVDKNRAAILNRIDAFSKRQQVLAQYLWPRNVQTLGAIQQRYEDGTMDLGDYLVALQKIAPQAWSAQKYPQLARFNTILTQEKTLSETRLKIEISGLLKQLEAESQSATMRQVSQLQLAWRTGTLSSGRYFAAMAELAQLYKFNAPEIARYAHYNKNAESLAGEALSTELRQYTYAVWRDALEINPNRWNAAIELAEMTWALHQEKKFWGEQFSPQDWQEYLKYRRHDTARTPLETGAFFLNQRLEILDIERYLARAESAAGIASPQETSISRWANSKTRFMQESYYRLAEKRDGSMMQHFIAGLKTEKSAPYVVLIAGGFHTEGMMEQLRQSGLSYAIVRPKLLWKTEETAAAAPRPWKNLAEFKTEFISGIQNLMRGTNPQRTAWGEKLVQALDQDIQLFGPFAKDGNPYVLAAIQNETSREFYGFEFKPQELLPTLAAAPASATADMLRATLNAQDITGMRQWLAAMLAGEEAKTSLPASVTHVQSDDKITLTLNSAEAAANAATQLRSETLAVAVRGNQITVSLRKVAGKADLGLSDGIAAANLATNVGANNFDAKDASPDFFLRGQMEIDIKAKYDEGNLPAAARREASYVGAAAGTAWLENILTVLLPMIIQSTASIGILAFSLVSFSMLAVVIAIHFVADKAAGRKFSMPWVLIASTMLSYLIVLYNIETITTTDQIASGGITQDQMDQFLKDHPGTQVTPNPDGSVTITINNADGTTTTYKVYYNQASDTYNITFTDDKGTVHNWTATPDGKDSAGNILYKITTANGQPVEFKDANGNLLKIRIINNQIVLYNENGSLVTKPVNVYANGQLLQADVPPIATTYYTFNFTDAKGVTHSWTMQPDPDNLGKYIVIDENGQPVRFYGNTVLVRYTVGLDANGKFIFYDRFGNPVTSGPINVTFSGQSSAFTQAQVSAWTKHESGISKIGVTPTPGSPGQRVVISSGEINGKTWWVVRVVDANGNMVGGPYISTTNPDLGNGIVNANSWTPAASGTSTVVTGSYSNFGFDTEGWLASFILGGVIHMSWNIAASSKKVNAIREQYSGEHVQESKWAKAGTVIGSALFVLSPLAFIPFLPIGVVAGGILVAFFIGVNVAIKKNIARYPKVVAAIGVLFYGGIFVLLYWAISPIAAVFSIPVMLLFLSPAMHQALKNNSWSQKVFNVFLSMMILATGIAAIAMIGSAYGSFIAGIASMFLVFAFIVIRPQINESWKDFPRGLLAVYGLLFVGGVIAASVLTTSVSISFLMLFALPAAALIALVPQINQRWQNSSGGLVALYGSIFFSTLVIASVLMAMPSLAIFAIPVAAIGLIALAALVLQIDRKWNASLDSIKIFYVVIGFVFSGLAIGLGVGISAYFYAYFAIPAVLMGVYLAKWVENTPTRQTQAFAWIIAMAGLGMLSGVIFLASTYGVVWLILIAVPLALLAGAIFIFHNAKQKVDDIQLNEADDNKSDNGSSRELPDVSNKSSSDEKKMDDRELSKADDSKSSSEEQKEFTGTFNLSNLTRSDFATWMISDMSRVSQALAHPLNQLTQAQQAQIKSALEKDDSEIEITITDQEPQNTLLRMAMTISDQPISIHLLEDGKVQVIISQQVAGGFTAEELNQQIENMRLPHKMRSKEPFGKKVNAVLRMALNPIRAIEAARNLVSDAAKASLGIRDNAAIPDAVDAVAAQAEAKAPEVFQEGGILIDVRKKEGWTDAQYNDYLAIQAAYLEALENIATQSDDIKARFLVLGNQQQLPDNFREKFKNAEFSQSKDDIEAEVNKNLTRLIISTAQNDLVFAGSVATTKVDLSALLSADKEVEITGKLDEATMRFMVQAKRVESRPNANGTMSYFLKPMALQLNAQADLQTSLRDLAEFIVQQ